MSKCREDDKMALSRDFKQGFYLEKVNKNALVNFKARISYVGTKIYT